MVLKNSLYILMNRDYSSKEDNFVRLNKLTNIGELK